MINQFENKEEYLLGRKLDLLLQTGQMLIQSLADSNRIDRNMRRVAVYMGIPSEKFHMHINYTTLMINISDGHYSITKFRKCADHGVNMDALSEISRLSWKALENNYSLDVYEAELKQIANKKRNYPRWLVILTVGLACGSFCKLFGCDWPSFFITSIASSIALFCRQEMHHRKVNNYLTVAISAFIAVLLAGGGSLFNLSQTPHHPIFASVLFLIPGVPIINCLDDMIDGFSIVGVTRAVIVFLTLGAISFGMIFAIKALHITDYSAVLTPHSSWWIIGSVAAIAATGFAVLFNVPLSTLAICAAGGAVTILTRNLLMYECGWNLPISSFCGALVVGIISIYLVHKVDVPAHVISIPPVIPMIPGVLMYKVIIGFLSMNVAGGNEQVPLLLNTVISGVNSGLTVLGISLGIAIPNVIGRRYFSNTKYKKRMKEALSQLNPRSN